jgi:PAS domain-containing protein
MAPWSSLIKNGVTSRVSPLKSLTAGDGRPQFIPKIFQNCWRTGGLEGPREREVRLRRSDGVFHWFLLRREALLDDSGAVVRWYGTGIDVEESRQKELLRVAEKRTLELIADGANLSSVLSELCAAIEEYTSATSLVFFDGLWWRSAGAHSGPSPPASGYRRFHTPADWSEYGRVRHRGVYENARHHFRYRWRSALA